MIALTAEFFIRSIYYNTVNVTAGEYTVKRVMEKNGGRWLVPANPKYPNIEITETDNFSVWGVVTFIIHKPVY